MFNSNSINQTQVENVLNVVIAYDDLETSERAMEICERMGRQLGSSCELEISTWKFTMFHPKTLIEAAAQEAADAAIIIISTDSTEELPAQVKAWVEKVVEMPRHANGILLVLLHGPSAELQKPALDYLCQVSRLARVPCISGVFDLAGDNIANEIEDICERVHQHIIYQRVSLLDKAL